MSSINKTRLKKYIAYILIIILAFVLQNLMHIFPMVFGVRPVLLISVAVCISMYEGEVVGAAMGLFAGALWDTVTVTADGYNALYLMVACAVCGVLLRIFLRNNIVTFALVNSLITMFYFITYVLFFITSRGIDSGLLLLARYYLPMAIYSVLLTPFVYLIMRVINKKYKIEYIEY